MLAFFCTTKVLFPDGVLPFGRLYVAMMCDTLTQVNFLLSYLQYAAFLRAGNLLENTMLSTEISSTSALLSIALAAAGKAVQRYTRLARKMREHGNEASAEVFERLAGEEQAYRNKISEWASLEGLVVDMDTVPGEWDDPNVVTDYDVQARNPFRCTPYKALAYAVHNIERAFLFYTYVAADSADSDVCHYARVLGREELGRAAALRVLRRQAWRVHKQQVTGSRIDPAVINSTADLLAVVICIEQYLARLFELAGSQFSELKNLVKSTRESLLLAERALHEAGLPGDGVRRELKKIGIWRDAMLSETSDASTALQRLCTDCDRSFAFYNSVVKVAGDEAVMLLAQQHSVLATQRSAELLQLTQEIN